MAVSALATRLKSEGHAIIDLAAGEPDFDTPAHIKAAAIEAIRAGETKYTPVDGTAALKAAIRDKFLRENGLRYQTDQVMVSCGAKQICYNVAMAVLDRGDEAIIPAPYWVSYPDMVKLANGSPVIVKTRMQDGFKLTPDLLESAITRRTRLLFLNSPSNPSGATYTQAEWRSLAGVLARHPDIIIAADDIYEHIFWGSEPFISIAAACPELYERTLTINGVSKGYAMTGWRIGFAGGPASLISDMKKLQGQSTSSPCSISQAASLAALTGDQGCVKQMRQAYRQRHDDLIPALNAIPGFQCRPADGAFYAFPDVSAAMRLHGIADDTAFAELLLQKAGVAVVPGSAFGAPGHVRLSFACAMGTLVDAMERIRRAVAA